MIREPENAFTTETFRTNVANYRKIREGATARIEGSIRINDIVNALRAPQTLISNALIGALRVGDWDDLTIEAFANFIQRNVEVFPLSVLTGGYADLAWRNVFKPSGSRLPPVPPISYQDSASMRMLRNLKQFSN